MSHATLTRNSALNYLAQGLSPTQVASALNCSPSYISQLLEEEEFATELAKLQQSSLASDLSYDEQVDRVEKKLLDVVEQTLGTVYNPVVALKMWRDINAGKRKHLSKMARAGGNQVNTTVVQLSLPAALTQKFTLNAQNQVIQAGDQTLVTLQSGNLAKMAARIREQSTKTLAIENNTDEANHVLPTIERQDEFGFTHTVPQVTAPRYER